MSKDKKYKFDFDLGFFSGSFWITVFLAILKFSGAIDISLWWVFAPIILSLAMLFIWGVILIILGAYYIMQGLDKNEDEDDDEDDEDVDENEKE